MKCWTGPMTCWTGPMTCWTGPMKYLVRGPPHSNLGDDSQGGETKIMIENWVASIESLRNTDLGDKASHLGDDEDHLGDDLGV
ncbi:hypothetical protein TNCV_1301081 [Trichonephila clavipes]|nr:hypothetical protein TNCV_1301081 [Trichonephila clavipes]